MGEEVMGGYRVTRGTVRRPCQTSFDPRFELTPGVQEDLRAVERADARLADVPAGDEDVRQAIEEALTRNAFGTASIEGNPLTLADVDSLLRGPVMPPSMASKDEREILNYVAYMRELPQRPLPRRVVDVARLHGFLFQGVMGDAGRFKTRPNFIGDKGTREVVFVPAAPARVRAELGRALEWFETGPQAPLVRVALFFHEFQAIHPFLDGNGRTGRALATHQLFTLGYHGVRLALMDFEFNADRAGYYEALAASDSGDFTPWLAYMMRTLRRTFEGGLERVTFRRRLPARLNGRQRAVAEWFARQADVNASRRVKFNDVHAAFPSVAPRTLKRDLSQLSVLRILVAEGRRKGTTYHIAPEIRRKRPTP